MYRLQKCTREEDRFAVLRSTKSTMTFVLIYYALIIIAIVALADVIEYEEIHTSDDINTVMGFVIM